MGARATKRAAHMLLNGVWADIFLGAHGRGDGAACLNLHVDIIRIPSGHHSGAGGRKAFEAWFASDVEQKAENTTLILGQVGSNR